MTTRDGEDRMTSGDVLERVEAVRVIANVDEEAHVAEYTLYLEVLRAISEGRCDDPRSVARAALATQEIAFDRWSG